LNLLDAWSLNLLVELNLLDVLNPNLLDDAQKLLGVDLISLDVNVKLSDGDLNCWRRFDFVGFRSKKVGAVGAL